MLILDWSSWKIGTRSEAVESSRAVRVFVSSPTIDLQKEREVVLEYLRRIDECQPVGMESFGSQPEDPIDVSLAQLQSCQAFVAFFGGVYGSGVTQLEYEEARRMRLPCFIFFRRPDLLPLDWEEREPRLAALKRTIPDLHSTFTTPDDLGAKIVTAISNWLRQPGSVPPELAVHLERFADDLSRELAREQAEPLGIDFDPDFPLLSGREEFLDTSIREHLHTPREKVLRDILDNKSIKRFVLLGEPGVGKTSILKHIALSDLERLRSGDAEARLPVYVRLIWYLADANLEELVIETVQSFVPSMKASQVRHWLSEGRVRVLLDGLNEVPIEEYRRCRAEIHGLMGRYPRSAFVVTDRPTYDGTLPAPAFRLQDWDLEQIRRYVERAVRQLASPQDPERLLERISYDPRLKSVASSPLPLGILTGLFGETGHIAVDRGELYQRFVERLLAREGQGARPVPSATVLPLQSLAFEAVRQGLSSLSEPVVLEYLEKNLQIWQGRGELANSVTVREILDRLRQGRWLLEGRAASRLQFRYTALQEYFAACELLARWQRGEPLAAFIANARFEEPIILMANLLKPRVGPFLDQVRRFAGIHVAARCLIGGGEEIPGRGRIVQQLAHELSSHVERRRSSAAAKFIFLRAPEAIPALAEALADDSGEVRWNASLAIERTLNQLEADRFFADILGSSDHSPQLKRTACQALGRSGSAAALGALIHSLDDPEKEIRNEAARALSRGLAPRVLHLLEAAARGEAGERIQAGALRALSLANVDSTAGFAYSSLNHHSPLVRSEARIALGRLGDEKVITEALRQATEAADLASRIQAIQELEDIGPSAQAAIQPLWDLLDIPELQSFLIQAFRDLGGTTTILDLANRDLAGADLSRRRVAVRVLGHLRDDRAIDMLARTLRDENETVAFTASDYFRAFGDRALPVLEAALEEARASGKERWHRAVLLALKKLGTRMSLQLLVEAVDDSKIGKIALKYLSSSEVDLEQVRLILRDPRPGSTSSCSGELETLLQRVQLQYDLRLAIDFRNGVNPEVWNELVEGTRSDLPAVRKSACAALSETQAPRAEPILRQIALEDPDSGVRTFAITALVRLGLEADEDLVTALAQSAADPAGAPALRQASIRALGFFGDYRGQELLKQLTRDEDSTLANAAVLAVAEIEARQRGVLLAREKMPEWISLLLTETMRSRYRRERLMAAETIATLDLPEGRKLAELGRLLKDIDVQVRRSAILSLRQIDTPEAMRRLGLVAEDSQPVLRKLAVDTLAARVELPEAYKALILFLRDPDLGLRHRAVEGLSALPSTALTKEHAQAVRGCLFADDPLVRGGMVEALPDPLLKKHLSRLLRLAEDRHHYPRLAAVRSLAQAPFEKAQNALTAALRDESALVRREAVRALAQMATPAAYLLLGRAAHDGHPTVAEEVLAALPAAPVGSAGLLLAPLVTHRSEEIRLRAITQVEGIGLSPEIGKALVSAIGDRRPSYREAQWRAIEMAGKLRAQVAAPFLAEFAGHTSSPLRERSVAALKHIGIAKVVPQLLAHLRCKDPSIKATVVSLLGESGSPDAVEALSLELKSRENLVRIAAVRALGQLCFPAAAEPLARFVATAYDDRERQEALSALGRLDTPVATRALVRALGPRNRWACEALLEHVIILSSARLFELLGDHHPAARAISARQLGKRCEAAAIPYLIDLLQDVIPEVRSAASEALGQIGSPEALEALFPALVSRDVGILLPALRAVGAHRWGDLRATGCLLAVLRRADQEEEEVVRAAEDALVLTGAPRLLPELLELLRDERSPVRQAARRVLEKLVSLEIPIPLEEGTSPQIISRLLAVFRHAGQLEPEIVRVAEQCMVRIGISQCRTELLELLRHRNPYARQVACRVLGALRAEEAKHRLVELLEDQNSHTRRAALDALRRIGSEEVADELLRFLQESDDWRLRATAVRALGEMQVEEAAGAVGEVLHSESIHEVRRAAATALGQIGTTQAIEMLGLAALDPHPAIRDSALLGLAAVPVDSPASGAAVDGLRLLLEDRYQRRRLRAVEALATYENPRAIGALLQAVHDQDPGIRSLAIRNLGRRRAGESLEILEDAALDPVPAVAHEARQALDKIRNSLLNEVLQLATREGKRYIYYWRQTREKIQPLLDQVRPEWIVRAILDRLVARPRVGSSRPSDRRLSPIMEESCIRLLGWVGRSVTREDLLRDLEEAILRAVGSERRDLRIAALIAIGDAGLEQSVATVLRFAQSHDSYEQQAAIRALVELRVKESMPTLRSLAAPDQSTYTRSAAIRAFEEIEDYQARPEVLDALGDSDRNLRWGAIVALGKIGIPEDIPALLQYLHDPDSSLRRAASISLRKLRAESAAQEFVALLKDPNPQVVEAAIRACNELKILGSVESLVDLALFSPPFLSEIAANTLQTLKPALATRYLAPFATSGCSEANRALEILACLDLPETRHVLASALGSPDPEIRLAAVQSLAGKSEQVRQLGLSRVLNDTAPRVRREVVVLLAECDLVPLFQPDLIALLADPDPDVRAEAATALGRGGGPEAVSPLIAAAEREGDGSVQSAMLRALARVGTPEAVARLTQWRANGATHERFRAVAAIQAERLREIVEETTSRSPAERLNDPNPYIQSAAIRQIGQKGLVNEAPKLLAFLRAPNPFLCQAAIDALSRLGERSALPTIRRLVRSENPWTRARVSEALGRFADAESLSILEELLEDRALYVRRAATEAILAIDSPRSYEIASRLLEIGDLPLACLAAERLGQRQESLWGSVLLRGLEHKKDEVRSYVLQQLAGRTLGTAEVSGLLRTLTGPNPPRVLREALIAVARTGARELAAKAAEFLTHRDSFLRAEAARTLGELDASSFLEKLVRLTRDPEQHVVIAAAQALGRMHSADKVPALAELLGHEEKEVVAAAIQALVAIAGAEAAEALGQVFSHPSGDLREEAVRALQGAPIEFALPHLLIAARDENHFVRERAVNLLGDWDCEEVVETLAGVLRDSNPYVRLAAVGALARLRSASALAKLKSALADSSAYVRARAIWALSQAPDEDTQEQLVAVLHDVNPHVRAAAVTVLGRCPGPSWIGPVADLARHEPIRAVRSLARRVLQQAAGRGSQTYLLNIEREKQEQEQELEASQMRELEASLSVWRQNNRSLQDEEELGRLLSCLTQVFSSNLISFRLSAGQLLVSLPPHPDLLSIYEYAVQDPLPDVRRAGLRCLARLGTPQSLERLQSAMAREESPDIRATLITEVEDLEDDEVVVRVLQSGLADPYRAVAQRALQVLVRRRVSRTTSLIIPLLSHSDDFLREAAINALGEIEATEAIPEIRRLLADPSWYVRQDTVKVLVRLGNLEVALEACRRGLEDPHLYVQLTSVQALRTLRDPAAVPLLLGQLRHPHAVIRSTAARGLHACMKAPWKDDFAGFGWNDMGELLLGLFVVERDVQVRADLVETLSAWNLPKAVRLLQNYLLDRSAAVRRKVLAVCESASENLDVSRLLAQLEAAGEEATVWVRRDLSSLVRGSDPNQFFPLLLRLVSDDDEFVRANAVYGLGRFREASGLRALASALDDPSGMVRDIAYRSLQGLLSAASPSVHQRVEWAEEIGIDGENLATRLRGRLEALRQGATAEEELEGDLASLASKVKSLSWIDRWYAVVLLAEHGNAAVEVLLRVWLEEPNATVQQEAERSLKHLPQELIRSGAGSFLKGNEENLTTEALQRLEHFLQNL